MPQEPNEMPKSLQAALIPLIVMGLTALAVKWQFDSKIVSDNIVAIATALAALVVAGYGWLMNRLLQKKVDRAEEIMPTITTTPKGSETDARLSVNDPTTLDPPVVTVKNTTNTP